MAHPKIKIAIVSHSLGLGGAERFSGLLSQMLDDLGYDIHNILIEDKIAYDYAGRLYNLGKVCESANPIARKIKKGILLRRYLSDNNITTVIDNRSRTIFIRELLTKWIYSRRDKIYVVHSFRMANYFPALGFAARMLYSDAKHLVCVSKSIEVEVNNRFGLKNTVTIYNPIPDLPIAEKSQIDGEYILFFGRLDDSVKNFGLLIAAYAKSNISEDGIRLVIMGDGPDREYIQDEIKRHDLQQSIILLPFQKNPYGIVARAKFTLLSSRYEGFPMSIIESLALGVPVVSVDCESGPSELIQNEQNGLLVPNHDVNNLAQAVARLARKSELYDICRNNAAASVAHLSIDRIAAQWKKILVQ